MSGRASSHRQSRLRKSGTRIASAKLTASRVDARKFQWRPRWSRSIPPAPKHAPSHQRQPYSPSHSDWDQISHNFPAAAAAAPTAWGLDPCCYRFGWSTSFRQPNSSGETWGRQCLSTACLFWRRVWGISRQQHQLATFVSRCGWSSDVCLPVIFLRAYEHSSVVACRSRDPPFFVCFFALLFSCISLAVCPPWALFALSLSLPLPLLHTWLKPPARSLLRAAKCPQLHARRKLRPILPETRTGDPATSD